ncbi:ATP-binding protein [Archaeoglobus veneficus]|uniref:ATPase n=1 Tax=Archaeoglobus veneficus (strain DSM 11195 / SNP6) TaxID=693661 RepID=F2KQP4_ARCVS|nr:ATP-binding protein [Archaeoglobus veneficus]AEA46606.1 ATPase [Archaeoglobus veneficus SNP6]
MLKEITFEYIDSLKFVDEIKRNVQLMVSPDIYALMGPRRVGKTFLMLKKADELLNMEKNVIYVSFDEPGLKNIPVRDFATLVRKEYPEGKVYLFLDEIQEWKDWDFNLRWLHDVKDFTIFVSGSSSVLMSSEIPSRLRGRYTSKLLLPLSFSEIADFELKTFREKGKALRLMEDYVKFGGFPEVWTTRSREKIISILETIFYRDIIERFRVRNVKLFEEVFYYVISNYANRMTYNALRRSLGALGVKLDTKTVMSYLKYMQDAFLIFPLYKFSYSEKEKMVSPRKVYIVDTCFSNLFFKGLDTGRKMENIVFIELLRKKHYENKLLEFYYYMSEDCEVDFVVREGNQTKQLIQVTYELNGENYEREVKGLVKASKKLRCDNLLIITWNLDDVLRENSKEIKVVPLWRWLMSGA